MGGVGPFRLLPPAMWYFVGPEVRLHACGSSTRPRQLWLELASCQAPVAKDRRGDLADRAGRWPSSSFQSAFPMPLAVRPNGGSCAAARRRRREEAMDPARAIAILAQSAESTLDRGRRAAVSCRSGIPMRWRPRRPRPERRGLRQSPGPVIRRPAHNSVEPFL